MNSPQPLDLRPIPLTTTLGELTGPAVLEDSDGSAIVLVPRPDLEGITLETRHVWNNSLRTHTVHRSTEIGDMRIGRHPAPPRQLYRLPPGTIMGQRHRFLTVLRVTTLVAYHAWVIYVLTRWWLSDPLWVLLFFVFMIVGTALIFRWPRAWYTYTYNYVTEDGTSHRFEDLLAEKPHLEGAKERVAELKAEYGALLSDLAYRIEYPALFDPMFPATRAFTAALISWDSATDDDLSGPEWSALAADLRVLFDTARTQAEAIGLDHLPAEAREPAGRALKAAQLAASTTHDGERAAALDAAVEILEGLALYYLPKPAEAQQMIEGRRILALPGRRTTREA